MYHIHTQEILKMGSYINSKIFPFHVVSDNEIFSMFGDLNHEIDISNNRVRTNDVLSFSRALPFYSCSDNAVMYECMSASGTILKRLENNGFSKKYIDLIESYTFENLIANTIIKKSSISWYLNIILML